MRSTVSGLNRIGFPAAVLVAFLTYSIYWQSLCRLRGSTRALAHEKCPGAGRTLGPGLSELGLGRIIRLELQNGRPGSIPPIPPLIPSSNITIKIIWRFTTDTKFLWLHLVGDKTLSITVSKL